MPKDAGGVAHAIGEIARNYHPVWLVAIVAAGILAWKMPQIIREVFTGARERKRVNAEIARKQKSAEQALNNRKKKSARKQASAARE